MRGNQRQGELKHADMARSIGKEAKKWFATDG
jgi:hypothetical protein